MKCPECGKQTKGRDHNNRGLRCTFCWARLPEPRRRAKAKVQVEAIEDIKSDDTQAEAKIADK